MRRSLLSAIEWFGVAALVTVVGTGWTSETVPRSAPKAGESSSAELEGVVVVLTLDTPVPEGNSAIWCLSFQLAWNELKKLAGGPIELANAGETAVRLDKAPGSDVDLAPGTSYYARAGFERDGIVRTIRKEMAERFPDHSVVDFEETGDGAVVYAFLRAGFRFKEPYPQQPEGILFRGSSGSAEVKAFGLLQKLE